MLTEMLKNRKDPLSYQKIKCSFLDYVQLLMIDWVIQAKNVDRIAKQWKRLPKSSKNQMFIFGYIDRNAKNTKGPLSYQKIKCSFLDYVQLLMIGQAIWAKNVAQNTKKWKRPLKTSKNKMFILGSHSTSDDRPSNLSKKCWPKHKKMKKAP